MITFQSHNMANLRFYLLDVGSIPETLRVFKQKYLYRNHYQLNLRIIGSSHAISLKTAFTELTECLLCLPEGNMKWKALMECPLPVNDDEFAVSVGDLQYTIRFHSAWLKQDEYQKWHLLLSKDEDRSLRYEFPSGKKTSQYNPLTLIKYSCGAKSIQIWTYHTYPDESGITNTYTRIDGI